MARYKPDGSTGSATTNAHASQNVGVAQSTVADLGKVSITGAAAVSQAPVSLLVPESAAFALVQSASGTAANAAQSAGMGVSMVAQAGPVPSQSGAAELVQITYNLTHTGWATAAAVSGSWANGPNATGANDGAFASNANTVTNAPSGVCHLTFAAQTNRTDLTITSVNLHTYWKNVAGAVSPCTWNLLYTLTGVAPYTSIVTGTASFTESVTPRITDITSIIAGSWANVASILIRFNQTGVASATPSTLSVDACKLVVVASRTDTL